MAEPQNSVTESETELTMCDVLEEEKELEDDANAVLGGSDDKNCSYDQGYIPRQALYACTTCSKNENAGVCLACCYACHDGHEVVELYTKRNFRCDCGNSKFGENKCKLNPSKTAVNSRNKYNQNFKGVYCICSRPYPDMDDDTPDEMIQCIFCEDWYHGRHLKTDIPDDYYEMICGKCMESHPFLFSYLNLYDIKVDVESCSPTKSNSSELKAETDGTNTETSVPVETVKEEIKEEAHEELNPTLQSDILNGEVKSIKEELEEKCKLINLKIDGQRNNGAAFWPENWRKELCSCEACLELYRKADCEFLLNVDDTIQAYEAKGKSEEGSESQYDRGLSALSQLDRVKQMEAIRAYTSMKGQLKEYLKEFADNKRTVKESDIKEFFERIGKKQKLNNGVPHFCR